MSLKGVLITTLAFVIVLAGLLIWGLSVPEKNPHVLEISGEVLIPPGTVIEGAELQIKTEKEWIIYDIDASGVDTMGILDIDSATDTTLSIAANVYDDVRFFANDDTEYLTVSGYGVESPIDQYTIEVIPPDGSLGCTWHWPLGDSKEPYRVVITPLGEE